MIYGSVMYAYKKWRWFPGEIPYNYLLSFYDKYYRRGASVCSKFNNNIVTLAPLNQIDGTVLIFNCSNIIYIV